MSDGIYWNSDSEVWGLFHKGECVIISVMRVDCEEEATKLGVCFRPE
jgi:hypothetical protein